MCPTRSYDWTAPEVGAGLAWAGDVEHPVRLGFIGLGLMGQTTLKDVLKRSHVTVTALCDVDQRHLQTASELVTGVQKSVACTCFSRFTDLNRAPDVDAVIISTPDHWHVLMGIDAMQCGKDAYIEKPLTLTVKEGRQLCQCAEETKRICQTGSQQRSSREFRYACELARNGYLGALQRIDVTIPANNRQSPLELKQASVPQELDYEAWLGPAPVRPYYEEGCHYNFRFIADFSGGQMTNWGVHMVDIAQWAMGTDCTGPCRVSGRGIIPSEGLFDTADPVDVTWEYADGITLHCRTTHQNPVLRLQGEKGSLEVGRGSFSVSPKNLASVLFSDQDVRLYSSNDHMGNFLSCTHSRETPVAPPEVGHRSASICHMGNIAIKLGRTLDWDPIAECFIDDEEANQLLSRPIRETSLTQQV